MADQPGGRRWYSPQRMQGWLVETGRRAVAFATSAASWSVEKSGVDASDLRGLGYLAVYVALATGVVAWAGAMVVLFRAITDF